MNYQEAVVYIEEIRKKLASDYSMDRVMKLAELMGHPEKKLRIVHIAGTNGKGSVGAYISNALAMSGYSVGRFASPALFDPREQIQRISGNHFGTDVEWISEEEVAGRITELAAAVDKMKAAGMDCPTAFEIETVMAYCQMACWHVDVAVVEVGMGGRNDATNIVEKPVLTVFTKISRDHTAFLGDTIEEIAYQKFGIIKAGCPVVSVRQDNAVMEMLKEICQHRGLKLRVAEPEQIRQKDFSLEKTAFRYQGYPLEIRQLGYYQPENAVTAFEALKLMAQTGFHKINISSVQTAFRVTKWTGRFELISKDPFLILDGAHNPDGAAALKKSLEIYFPAQRFRYIFGVFRDKDYEKILDEMLPLATSVYTVKAAGERGMDPKALAEIVERKCRKYDRKIAVESCETVTKALQKMEKDGHNTKTIIFGSLSFLHEVYRFFDTSRYI